MGKQRTARTEDVSADVLVRQNGKAEKRLLRQERRAERLLTEARARLRKAQVRLERRLSAVSDAEALLRTRQAARVAGPNGSNGTSPEAVPPSVATATVLVAQASEVESVADEAPAGVTADADVATTLILPPAAKPPVKQRTRRATAPKGQQAS